MRAALGFLTAFGGAAPPDRRAVVWFGPVGALVGLVVGAVWWGAGELWPPLLAAVLAVVADAALTGMLHLDGLADSADGLLPPLDRPRRLEVMSDPHAGVFAVVVVVLVLTLRIAALATLSPDPWLLAGLWAAARAAMGVTLATFPYARSPIPPSEPAPAPHPEPAPEWGSGLPRSGAGSSGGGFGAGSSGGGFGTGSSGGGLASVFMGVSAVPSLVVGAAALAVAAVAGGWPAGPAAVAALVVGAATVVGLAQRRLGGFTGDVLGAAGVVGETCALVVAAAKW